LKDFGDKHIRSSNLTGKETQQRLSMPSKKREKIIYWKSEQRVKEISPQVISACW